MKLSQTLTHHALCGIIGATAIAHGQTKPATPPTKPAGQTTKPATPPAKPVEKLENVQIPKGTVLQVVLDTELTAKNVKIGKTIEAHLSSSDDSDTFPAKTSFVGKILEIMSGDKGSREDIPAWCKKIGHEYMGVLERDGYDSLFVTRKK